VRQLREVVERRLQAARRELELEVAVGRLPFAAGDAGGDHEPAVAMSDLHDSVRDLAQIVGRRRESQIRRARDLSFAGETR
jgi:hypothetical protein